MQPLAVFKQNSLAAAASGILLLYAVTSAANAAGSAPVVEPPYKLSVFAKGGPGVSQPDSLVLWRDTVLVGYGNGVAKDGSDGKSSTIVQYSLTGTERRRFSVKGHNDGLRLVGQNELWALQNEDANPNLVVIDLQSGAQTKFSFPRTPHGGGYDDIAIMNGHVFISASNPTPNSKGINVFPALLEVASLAGGTVHLQAVLSGDAHATDIPTGKEVTLNLTDPDSLAVDQRGNIVLDSQADDELVFVRDPDTSVQSAHLLKIKDTTGKLITVDDTAFATVPNSVMLVSDLKANAVYRIEEPGLGFEPGVAYSASDTAGFVGQLNLDNGVLTPIATGFGSMRGVIFVPPAKK